MSEQERPAEALRSGAMPTDWRDPDDLADLAERILAGDYGREPVVDDEGGPGWPEQPSRRDPDD